MVSWVAVSGVLFGFFIWYWLVWGRAAWIFKRMAGETVYASFLNEYFNIMALDQPLRLKVICLEWGGTHVISMPLRKFKRIISLRSTLPCPSHFLLIAYQRDHEYNVVLLGTSETSAKWTIVNIGEGTMVDSHEQFIRFGSGPFQVLKFVSQYSCVCDFFIKQLSKQAVPILKETKNSLKSKSVEAVRLAMENPSRLLDAEGFDIMSLVKKEDEVRAS